LTEICNEFFETDDKGKFLKIKLNGDHNSEVQTLIEDEFNKFIEIFKFDERGSKYIREWLTEGELFFENIVSVKKPELGIIGVTRVSTDRCDPLYYDLDNELIDCFLLRAKAPDMYPFQWGKFSQQSAYGNHNQNQLLFMNEKQLTYIANDQWIDGKKWRVPVLSYAHRPYRQLALIEDATVIYMLVRAPERLVFNVDVGNMQPSKAEQYMKRLMGQFWSKKTIAQDGRIENVYDPQGMLENYWFPKTGDGKGSDVKSIGGGNASPDNLEILTFFVQKLYQSLKVPLSRLNSETAFNDSASITREELCFAEYIINLQKLWASAIKRAFIIHLKLKGKKVLQTAKNLNIDVVSNKQHSNAFNISQVYKDNFNHKCWDYYDMVSETVSNALSQIDEEIYKEKETLLFEMSTLEGFLNDVDNGVINESNDFSKTSCSRIVLKSNALFASSMSAKSCSYFLL
jgi:gas vesicle protein